MSKDKGKAAKTGASWWTTPVCFVIVAGSIIGGTWVMEHGYTVPGSTPAAAVSQR